MTRLEFGPSNTTPILFLHGFPGVRSRQNRDIAERVSSFTGRRSIVFLYDGLGQAPGEFSFDRCMADVEKAFVEISSQSRAPIDLVGHSWGGFMAIRLTGHHGEKVRRLVLMSPLLRFFDQATCEKSFAETARDNSALNLGDLTVRAREFVAIGAANPYREILSKIPVHVETTILQAADDQVTPGSVSKDAPSFIPGKSSFEIRETDHSFLLDRDGTVERIAHALS
ncbi:MAG: alpha/beta hydrolase [Bdellovibrionota bacterium]